VRDADTLLPVSGFERPTRALIAARLDTVRLIDNLAMPVWR
jgi:pantothenate synthetase